MWWNLSVLLSPQSRFFWLHCLQEMNVYRWAMLMMSRRLWSFLMSGLVQTLDIHNEH